MFDSQQIEDVTAAFKTAIRHSQGTKKVALAIGKKYPTFMREIAPLDPCAKLGFFDAIAIIKVLENNDKVLDEIEKELGVKIQVL